MTMIEHFKRLLTLAEEIGTVSRVNLYKEYVTLSGKMENGKKFTLTLDIMEVTDDD